jgi:hypothetical protein
MPKYDYNNTSPFVYDAMSRIFWTQFIQSSLHVRQINNLQTRHHRFQKTVSKKCVTSINSSRCKRDPFFLPSFRLSFLVRLFLLFYLDKFKASNSKDYILGKLCRFAKPAPYPFEAQWLQHIPPAYQNSAFCPQSVSVCSVWFSQ